MTMHQIQSKRTPFEERTSRWLLKRVRRSLQAREMFAVDRAVSVEHENSTIIGNTNQCMK
jgi:hypothetical protein